jgi:hypothetical protein
MISQTILIVLFAVLGTMTVVALIGFIKLFFEPFAD